MIDVDDVLRRAHELGDEGDWEGMAELLRDALISEPDEAALLCWLGVAERELGMEGIAFERFKRCLALGPEDPVVLATAGAGLAAFDDPEAEAALRTAAMLAPRLPLARWSYGAYLSREGYLEDALRELCAARELDPDDGTIAYELGVGLALAGKREEAVDAFASAVELAPDDSWARVVLGLALLEDERVEEAVAELLDGARERPDDVEAQILAALAAAAAGSDALAWEMLERARQNSAGADAALVGEAEEPIEEGADEARRFLLREVAPVAFHDRLMTRP